MAGGDGSDKLQVERTLRVYHDKPAIALSGRVSNRSDQDVVFETARMLDLSADDGGWWWLGRLLEAPAAVGYPGTSPPCRPASGGNLAAGEQSYDSSGVLAASYWVNDRLYHREVCDMSVGAKAGLEEARLRMALMTLCGCSISFSDDFRELEPPRIRLMQKCLPPGNPAARPLDLFEREVPSVWHLHCKNEADAWDVVGLFNFGDRPQQRTVSLAALGLPPGTQVTAFEFWEGRFLGILRDTIRMTLPPQTSRILAIRRLTARPQLLGTDMHLLGGYHELARLSWDEDNLTLSGAYRRAAGLAGKAYFYVPRGFRPRSATAPDTAVAPLQDLGNGVWLHEVQFKKSTVPWSFDPKTIDRELGWAGKLGFNTTRCFIQYLVWKHDPEGLKKRLAQFLAIAERHGITVMPVLFDDCAFGEPRQLDPYLGKQRDPIPGMIAPSWTPSPGRKLGTSAEERPRLEQYVGDLVGTFREDPRIIAWDLVNEPMNVARVGTPELLRELSSRARAARPTQPLTVGVWNGDAAINEVVLARSDIVSFHRYGPRHAMQAAISISSIPRTAMERTTRSAMPGRRTASASAATPPTRSSDPPATGTRAGRSTPT